ncbi:hypothetical protein SAMN02745751_03031 [Dethiosulfatibacter aminovorans DSM 17477]|uniref:Uncharacterized protein n=1 Tax=Dethiosulfatibacter aminovorans DSM 17477 TaxID=1121476 RepID=A0A1M6L047_9FIRM|nr:hypothetical protein [Dethiosulfatibacter aminovorans]SHJ64608.1 hypothetical protein SAMN02745751_03031 [Dethiosulfatibacter aminovorans DSM 17477]
MYRIRTKTCPYCNSIINWKPKIKRLRNTTYHKPVPFKEHVVLGKKIFENETSVTYSYHCMNCQTEYISVISKTTKREL